MDDKEIRRVAVIGGGTAGFMAAAHLSRYLPHLELTHIYDSRVPAIGVGEGTLPTFPNWIYDVAQLEFDALEEEAQATLKLGVRFEDWGSANSLFFHNFSGQSYAYHISAGRLPELLRPCIQGVHLDRRVTDLISNGREVEIHLEGEEVLVVDFAFDARGFPVSFDPETYQPVSGIPTDAALIRPGPVSTIQGGTRAIARSHGWIFAIPLTSHTSYGYGFKDSGSSTNEIRADFDLFFEKEGLPRTNSERFLRFPNFMRRRFFDGSLFHIGNAASFMEPLEATAIGVILLQLQIAAFWLGDQLVGVSGDERWQPDVLAEVNREIAEAIKDVALFVSWHYSKGSFYDSPFWNRAQENFEDLHNAVKGSAAGDRFHDFLASASHFPLDYLGLVRDTEVLTDQILPKFGESGSLGGFDIISFAQIGHGLGFFESSRGENR